MKNGRKFKGMNLRRMGLPRLTRRQARWKPRKANLGCNCLMSPLGSLLKKAGQQRNISQMAESHEGYQNLGVWKRLALKSTYLM
jgi:hypothetical protein